jgi:hypothetical protein
VNKYLFFDDNGALLLFPTAKSYFPNGIAPDVPLRHFLAAQQGVRRENT